MTIRIVRLRPGRSPIVAEIENTLEAQQAEVGGYIEVLRIAEGIVLVCNEDGRRLIMDVLGTVNGFEIVGAAFFARVDINGETVALSDDDVEMIKRMFKPSRKLS